MRGTSCVKENQLDLKVNKKIYRGEYDQNKLCTCVKLSKTEIVCLRSK